MLLRGSDFQECPVQIVFNFKNRVCVAYISAMYRVYCVCGSVVLGVVSTRAWVNCFWCV